MPDNEIRDQLAAQLAAHLYDRGERVAEWPEDERELHRDPGAWTDWLDRAEKVQALRYRKAADELLVAGWRPPARVITSVAELDALPDETVIRTRHGGVAQKSDDVWEFPNEIGQYLGDAIDLPVTVLHVPEEARRHD